jgi:membrane-bound lytic murein transglycosylase MltF
LTTNNWLINLKKILIKYKNLILLGCFFLCILILLFLPTNKKPYYQHKYQKLDFPDIIERGYINVIVEHNSMNFFVHHGRVMGLQYELLDHIEKRWNININQIVINDLGEALALVAFDSIDILTSDITIVPGRYPCIDFSIPLYKTKMVLVLYDSIKPSTEINDFSKLDIKKLENKIIAVPTKSIFINFLNKLKKSLNLNFQIKELIEEPESILVDDN